MGEGGDKQFKIIGTAQYLQFLINSMNFKISCNISVFIQAIL